MNNENAKREEDDIRWLSWENGKEWGKIECPMHTVRRPACPRTVSIAITLFSITSGAVLNTCRPVTAAVRRGTG